MNSTTWNIDPSHSGIHFSVRHMVFAKVRGRFATFSGTIRTDPADLTRAEVAVEIAADSIDTSASDRDTHLRSPDFLDVEQFPHITFKSKGITRSGGDRYQVRGDLTIHGVTREVTLEAEHNGEGQDPWGNTRASFGAKTSIDRRDFGLKWNQVLEAGGVLVGERIDIELEVEAVKAAASSAA